MNISWWETSIEPSALNKIKESFKNRNFSQGSVTKELEEKVSEILEVPFVVATTSGSMALLMSLMALGIKPGDEVIIPNMTFIATAHAVLMSGAKVVLIDTYSNIPLIDVEKIETAINEKTKAIIPVHLNGRSADMKRIHEISGKYELAVIEDAAQALYSRNKQGFLGTQSDIGCFSMGMTKIISCGQGGFMVTKDEEIYNKLMSIRSHGINDVLKDVSVRMGFNFKFNDIVASVAVEQLASLKERADYVNKIYEKYVSGIKALPFITIIPVNISMGEVSLWTQALCPERANLIKYLDDNGIKTRIFLPNLNTVKHLKNSGDFPNSKVFSDQGIYLPCGPKQSPKNIDRVIEVLRKYKGIR